MFRRRSSTQEEIIQNENYNLAIARSSSSRADPGLRVAFECLNVYFSVTALAAWPEAFKCLNF